MLGYGQTRKQLLFTAIQVAIFCGCVVAGPVELISWNHIWRYEDSGTDLGTAWRAATFDDSSWPSGRSLLGWPPSEVVPAGQAIRTRLRTIKTNGPEIATHYFRTTFEWTQSTTGVVLVFSNLLDDGAVFWLNGNEIQRVGVAEGEVTHYSIGWNREVATYGYTVFHVFDQVLRPGLNTLAVQVCDDAFAGSVDVVWGCSLHGGIPEAPQVSSPPEDVRITVLEGRSTNLTAIIPAHPPPTYQWYRNGSAITRATNATLAITNMSPADVATYFCAATNMGGGTVSSNFVLSLAEDLDPPALIEAFSTIDPRMVVVRFSERMEPSEALERDNYFMYEDGGSSNRVFFGRLYSPVADAGSVVVLETSEPYAPGSYILVLPTGTVRDTQGNALPANGIDNVIAVQREVRLVAANEQSSWRYEATGVDLGAVWREPTFDESSWRTGTALFYGTTESPQSINLPTPRTALPLTNSRGESITTYYFRTRFTAPLCGLLPVRVRHIFNDDGAVVYLNGEEILRFAMPPPPDEITYDTLANGATDLGWYPYVSSLHRTPTYPLAASLRGGDNVVAVEVHQWRIPDNDMGMALELTTIEPGPMPRLMVEPGDNGTIVLSWIKHPKAVLQESDRFPAEWTDSPQQRNYQTIAVASGARFYRLKSSCQ